MSAIVTLLSNHRVRVNKDRIIRTGLRAGFAGNTTAIIKIHDTVFACVQGFRRTNLNARSIFAMITTHHVKKPTCIGEFAFFDVFYPSAIHADRDIVFRFTSHCASVATDTFAVIYDKAKVHKKCRLKEWILVTR